MYDADNFIRRENASMRLRLIPVYIFALTLTACSVSDLPFVYRPEVRQGTIIEQGSVERLEPGMTRRQVRFLMGSPSIDDPLHTDRWDYVYRIESGDGEVLTSEHVTVFFEDDRLAGARGSYIDPDGQLARGAQSREQGL